MARTKNRGYQQTLTPTYTARLWKMGGYIRLSREDLQKINRGLDDSNSVKNQRDILNDFHHNHVDEFESYVEYVDGPVKIGLNQKHPTARGALV